jgi:protein TonB
MSRLCWFAVAVAVAGAAGTPLTAAAQPSREAELTAIVAARPAELAPYAELARLHAREGRRDEAEAVLREALKVHRDSGAVYAVLAGLFTRADGDKLLAIAREWAAVDPTNARPFLLGAEVHIHRAGERRDQPADALESLTLARELLETAMQQSPGDPMARTMRLSVLIRMAGVTADPAQRAALERDIEAARAAEIQMRVPGRAPAVATPIPPPATQYPNAVRVGGNVPMPKKIRDVKPVMPELAASARVQGVVIIEAVIDEAGRVAEARVLRSIPLLDQAALDAVRQWMFTPTVIDGKTVPVIITMTVQFQLEPQ